MSFRPAALGILALCAAAFCEAQIVTADTIVKILGTRGFSVEAKVVLAVEFDYNSDELTAAAVEQLTELGRALTSSRLEDRIFELSGHTDSRGSASYNKRLSQRRAERAKRFLLERFEIASSRIVAVGHGIERPLAGVDPAAAKNRRVEVRDVGRYEQ